MVTNTERNSWCERPGAILREDLIKLGTMDGVRQCSGLCAVSSTAWSALPCSKYYLGGPNWVCFPRTFVSKWKVIRKQLLGHCRASTTTSGPASQYAKEMERYAAKESLLLAIKDAGGLDALTSGKTTDIERIDVNERVISLERLNPTPRPTTSPFLEGSWQFQWFGAGSPGLFAARFLLERFPSALASIKELDLLIMDGYAKAAANLKLLSSLQSNFILTTKLTVEGPLRLKEEYIEGVLEMPSVPESSIPTQLKGAYSQVLAAFQQLPPPVKETISNGLKIPLSGTFQRMLIVSYLDNDVMIVRDIAGVPDILSRLDSSPLVSAEPVTEYES